MKHRWQAPVLLMLIPAVGGAQMRALIRPYEARPVPAVDFQNSGRIFDLIRAGQLLKIDVVDHVIIGRASAERAKDYSSLRELGYFYA